VSSRTARATQRNPVLKKKKKKKEIFSQENLPERPLGIKEHKTPPM
jgi:hypothetical protein